MTGSTEDVNWEFAWHFCKIIWFNANSWRKFFHHPHGNITSTNGSIYRSAVRSDECLSLSFTWFSPKPNNHPLKIKKKTIQREYLPLFLPSCAPFMHLLLLWTEISLLAFKWIPFMRRILHFFTYFLILHNFQNFVQKLIRHLSQSLWLLQNQGFSLPLLTILTRLSCLISLKKAFQQFFSPNSASWNITGLLSIHFT